MNREEILKILSTYDLTEDEKEYLYLQLYFSEQLNSQADEQIQEFYKQQKENRDSILTEIAKIMLSYTVIESIMSIANSDKLKLKKQLNTLIQNKIQSELNYETLKTKELLESTGKNKYNINNYINDIGMNVNWDIKLVEDKILNDIINKKVDDKTWDDRLWNNKNDLQKDLKTEIDNFLNGKTTVNEIEDKIKKKYNSNAYETKRIVQDNIARVQEGINEQWREDHNVKWVLYMATLCHNTCGKCSQYDGKDYPVNKKPVDLPQHPFCRCTYVNLPNKDWRPSERFDNVAKEKVNWQTYEEWMKNKNEKSNYLRVSNSKNVSKEDLIAIENDLNMLPKTHRKILDEYVKEIKVVPTGTSNFNRKTGVVTILEGMEEGELIHELGHALETKFDLYNNEKFINILKADLPDSFTCLLNIKTTKEFIQEIDILDVDCPKFISKYQSRIYDKDMYKNERIDFSTGEFNYKVLGEYFSEGYKGYILNPNNLKEKDIKLYNFIKELV